MDFELDGERFNWLDEKAEANARKHGVSFLEAAEAITDARQIEMPDLEHSRPGEQRYTVIGFTQELRLLRVTFRAMLGGVAHIISAREANPVERRIYATRNR